MTAVFFPFEIYIDLQRFERLLVLVGPYLCEFHRIDKTGRLKARGLLNKGLKNQRQF
jgi:hypothetical protein